MPLRGLESWYRLKNRKFKLLSVAGLFSRSTINNVAIDVIEEFFGIDGRDISSIDLEDCKNVREAKAYIDEELTSLGSHTILIGHSAGGQLLEHFIGHPNVVTAVSVCGPSHNPLDYPMWLLPKTATYIGKTVSNQHYRLPGELSRELFGMAPPAEYVTDSWGHLIGQLNFGCLAGNFAPRRPKIGAECLFVATTGDRLITPRSVKKTADRFGGHYMCLDHPNHYPQLGVGAKERMLQICRKIGEIVPELGGRVGMMD